MALTSSEASSSVIDLSLSMTSSTTALICTFDAASLEWLGAATGPMKAAERGAAKETATRKERSVEKRGAGRAVTIGISGVRQCHAEHGCWRRPGETR